MKILAFGEVMMRLNPEGFKKMIQTDQMSFSFTGTGLNILAGLSQNGYDTEILTVLPDNNLGKTATSNIRKLGISDKQVQYQGQHMGIYILEMGYGGRSSEVTYLDRVHSAFNEYIFSDMEINVALEGVEVVHICGIALSVSKVSRTNALNLAKRAYELGICVCFDFNFRASLNQDEQREILLLAYKEILTYVSITFGSLRDLTDLLLIEGDDEKHIIQTFMTDYQMDVFAGTYRLQKGPDKQLQGFLYHQDKKIVSEVVHYEILDRIGTGDAFVAGCLTGLIEKWKIEETLNFAVYSAVLAHTTMGDSPILSKEFILHYMKNKSDIIR